MRRSRRDLSQSFCDLCHALHHDHTEKAREIFCLKLFLYTCTEHYLLYTCTELYLLYWLRNEKFFQLELKILNYVSPKLLLKHIFWYFHIENHKILNPDWGVQGPDEVVGHPVQMQETQTQLNYICNFYFEAVIKT